MIVNLLTYTDCEYFQHVACLYESLKDVANKSNFYNLFIIHSCNDENIISKFSKSIEINESHIKCNLIAFKKPENVFLKAKKSYLNDSIYDKLFIYDLIPPEIEKILFIDSDIIFKKDPSFLYKLNIDETIIAAVQDEFLKFPQHVRDIIGLESHEDYFNSGVMLVNLANWKKSDISKIALNFAIEKGHLTSLHDQDAYNYAIKGRWIKISSLWNPRPNNILKKDDGEEINLSKYAVYRMDLAYLVHFSGPDKPWTFRSLHPQKHAYLKFLRRSGFKDYKFKDVNFWNQILKFKKLIINNYLYWKKYKHLYSSLKQYRHLS